MKSIKLLSLLLLLGLLFVGCKEQQTDGEWNRLFGYNTEDIAGTYSFSNVTDAFEGLTEGKYSHICEDAQITVTQSTGNTIKFRINCPSDSFNRLFEGRPCVTDDDFLINIKSPASSAHPTYELTAYVFENAQGDIRLHGFARHIKYDIVAASDGTTVYNVKSKTNYYFDVIKQ